MKQGNGKLSTNIVLLRTKRGLFTSKVLIFKEGIRRKEGEMKIAVSGTEKEKRDIRLIPTDR